MSVAILIPAAGASSRMGGRDKLLEMVDGQPQLRRIAETALALAPTYVTLPAADHPRRVVLPPGVKALVVPDWETGMAASLRAGAEAMPSGMDILVLPADMPELDGADIERVIAAKGRSLIARGCDEAGTPGHPVLFDQCLRPALMRLTGDEGARSIIAAHAKVCRLVPLPGDHATLDLDTPEDWAAWRLRRSSDAPRGA